MRIHLQALNMRRFILPIAATYIMACSPQDPLPEVPVADEFDTVTATLVVQGSIEGIGHIASGIASVYERDGKYTVVLDPFSSQNGPDLKVYLSKDANASEYLRLGDLKSTMGRQSYGIPGPINITDYPFLHVWCEKYTVVFARAEIR
jgi:hypothetical protein